MLNRVDHFLLIPMIVYMYSYGNWLRLIINFALHEGSRLWVNSWDNMVLRQERWKNKISFAVKTAGETSVQAIRNAILNQKYPRADRNELDMVFIVKELKSKDLTDKLTFNANQRPMGRTERAVPTENMVSINSGGFAEVEVTEAGATAPVETASSLSRGQRSTS